MKPYSLLRALLHAGTTPINAADHTCGPSGKPTAVGLWQRKYSADEPVAKRAGQKRAAARFTAAVKAQPKTSPKPLSRQVRRRSAMGRGPEFLRA